MHPTEPKVLFVYGTLRSDLGNNHLTEDAEPVGYGRIPGIMFTTDWFPAVCLTDEASQVKGQVLSFERFEDGQWIDRLNKLDHYEGVPHLFDRHLVTVCMEDGTSVAAQCYLFVNPMDLAARSIVPSGDWANVLSGELS